MYPVAVAGLGFDVPFTDKVTVYLPGCVYICAGLRNVLPALSPNVQLQLVILSPVDVSVNCTLKGATPLTGVAE